MAGITFTGAELEQRAGFVAQNLWNALDDARQWYLWLNDSSHSGIWTPLGIATDQSLIMGAAGDLGGPGGLWSVAHSKTTPSGASDYFSNAKQLTGLIYAGSAIS